MLTILIFQKIFLIKVSNVNRYWPWQERIRKHFQKNIANNSIENKIAQWDSPRPIRTNKTALLNKIILW